MNRAHLQLLFDYHHWAMDHLIKALMQLPAGKLEATSPHLYHETAYKTVRHVLDVDWSWLRRCQGLPDIGYLWDVVALPDIQSLQHFLHEEADRTRDYLAGLSEQGLAATIEFENGQKGPAVWVILNHIVNHGTEHRTELGHFLTELDASPGELGLFYYVQAIRNRP